MKVCNYCLKSLPLDAFYRDCDSPDGYRRRCKKCGKEASSAPNVYPTPENTRRGGYKFDKDGNIIRKKCVKCFKYRPFEDFHAAKHTRDKKKSKCKKCAAKYQNSYSAKKRDKERRLSYYYKSGWQEFNNLMTSLKPNPKPIISKYCL